MDSGTDVVVLVDVAVGEDRDIEAGEVIITPTVAGLRLPIPTTPVTTMRLEIMGIQLNQHRHRRTCLPRHILTRNPTFNILQIRPPTKLHRPSHNPQARLPINRFQDLTLRPTSPTLLPTLPQPPRHINLESRHPSMRRHRPTR